MRRRWHDWVIVLSVLALAGAGIYTLWGEDIRHLFGTPPAVSPEPEPPGR